MDFLANLKISQKTLRLITEIDEFKGQWQALGQLASDRLSALKKIATIESIGSSTRIEGVKMTDAEIERLLTGLQIHSFRSRDEQEVAGYAELMETIFSSWKEIQLTENHIKQFHGILLKHSHKDERHRGNYKTLPNHVEAFDENGQSLGVIFKTASPFDTPRMMESLVAWTNDALNYGEYHPLLVIADFVVRFLAIHPFQDGNGRLSRAITTLLFLRSGYSYVPYSSMERVIEDNKDRYYLSLQRNQSSLDDDEIQPHEWLEFFLECMVTQKNALEKKVERERSIGALPPLSEQLVQLIREHGRVSVAGMEKVTGANRNTIKFHLKKLVESGYLKPRGIARGTWYELRSFEARSFIHKVRTTNQEGHMKTEPFDSLENFGYPEEIIKSIDFYTENYLTALTHLNFEGKLFLGRKENRKCRFCGKTDTETTFKKEAHALPNCIGNRSLFSYYECDTCNEHFGKTFEDHFAKYTNFQRALSQIRGKNGVPTVKGPHPQFRIEMTEKGMTIKAPEGEMLVEMNNEKKEFRVTSVSQTYIPRNVYKCLVKMALTLLPDEETEHFRETFKWLQIKDVEQDPIPSQPENKFVCWYSFTPGVSPFPWITTALLKRKEDNVEVPYMFFFIAFSNYTYQIFIPQCEKDMIHDGKTVKFYRFPNIFHKQLSKGAVSYKTLDLTSNEPVKGMKNEFTLGFEKIEEIDPLKLDKIK